MVDIKDIEEIIDDICMNICSRYRGLYNRYCYEICLGHYNTFERIIKNIFHKVEEYKEYLKSLVRKAIQ